MAALAARSTENYAITFEAPGEKLFASRLGLKSDNEAQGTIGSKVWHYGILSDPIFTGTCNGPLSSCYLAGYAMESQCHTGNICIMDIQPKQDILHHRMSYIVDSVLSKEDFLPICYREDLDCEDCPFWSFGQ